MLLNENCTFRRGEDGVPRCLPVEDAHAILRYRDQNCTQPVIARSCGSTAHYVIAVDGPSGCEPDSEPYAAYEVGAPLASQTTYARMGTTCLPKNVDPSLSLYTANPVLPDEFVGATLTLEAQGPRMALSVLDGDDGSRETRGVRDMQVGAACSGQWVSASEMRCVPNSPITGGLVYSDSGCGAPLLVQTGGAGCALPPFALDHHGSGCTDVVSAVAVGASQTPGQIFQGGDQACMPLGIVPSNWSFFAEGPVAPPSTFQQVFRIPAGTGRLRTPLDLTEEGLSMAPPAAFRDGQVNVSCDVKSFADGSTRCVSVNAATVKFYRDNQCTIPVVPISPGECGVPAPSEVVLTAAPSGPGCASPVIQHVHAIGPQLNALAVYRKSGANCTAIGTSSLNGVIHDLGGELPFDVYPLVTESLQ